MVVFFCWSLCRWSLFVWCCDTSTVVSVFMSSRFVLIPTLKRISVSSHIFSSRSNQKQLEVNKCRKATLLECPQRRSPSCLDEDTYLEARSVKRWPQMRLMLKTTMRRAHWNMPFYLRPLCKKLCSCYRLVWLESSSTRSEMTCHMNMHNSRIRDRGCKSARLLFSVIYT